MRICLALFFSLFATLSPADVVDPPLPALYAVTGVASDDTLNVRAAPDPSAPVIATLAPDARGIEVVGLSRAGRWAQINVDEASGWVAIRYLSAQPVERTALGLPASLQCFGTEPFWSMRFADTPSLILRTPDADETHDITTHAPAAAFVDLSDTGFRFVWRDDQTPVTAHILPGRCYDGMSNRAYMLHYTDDYGPRIGCCSLN